MMKINELKEGMTGSLQLMLVSFTEKATSQNKPYVQAEMTDGRDTIQVKFWDMTAAAFEAKFKKGSVVEISLTAKKYLDSLSYTAGKSMRALKDSEYDIEDFIKLPPVNPQELYELCLGLVADADAKHSESKALVEHLYHKYEEKLKIWSAAKSVHHNLRGGLLWHMYRMALLAKKLPITHFNMTLDVYEKTMSGIKKKYGDQVEVKASTLAKYTMKEVSEEECLKMKKSLDFSDPYLKIARDLMDDSMLDQILKNRQGLQALQIADIIDEIYPVLDKNLIKAAILLAAMAGIPQSSRIYRDELLTGSLYPISRKIAMIHSEEAKCLRKVLLSADLGQSGTSGQEMLAEACALSQIWAISAYSYVDKYVLAAGCLLHDIGKLVELSTDEMGIAEYSEEGSMFGHMILGLDMLEEAFEELHTSKPLADLYRHIIASHHGKIEWGALCLPSFPEAAIVHHIDMIDSRMYQFEEMLEKMEGGELSEKSFSLGTKVYKAKV